MNILEIVLFCGSVQCSQYHLYFLRRIKNWFGLQNQGYGKLKKSSLNHETKPTCLHFQRSRDECMK